MMGTRPTRTTLTLGVAVVLMLAGCGGSDAERSTSAEGIEGADVDVDWDAPGRAGGGTEGSALDQPLGSSRAQVEREPGPPTSASSEAGADHSAPGDLGQPLPNEAVTDPVLPDQPLPPFDHSAFNPWTDPAVDARSTFGLDVDTISYTRIREAVAQGHPVDPDTVEAIERSASIPLAAVDRSWDDATASLRVAGTAAAWAELLRGSPYATNRDPRDLAAEATQIASALDSPELDDWARLVKATTDA